MNTLYASGNRWGSRALRFNDLLGAEIYNSIYSFSVTTAGQLQLQKLPAEQPVVILGGRSSDMLVRLCFEETMNSLLTGDQVFRATTLKIHPESP